MGIMLDKNEYDKWLQYYSKLFPTATPEFLSSMADRMMKDLKFFGLTKRISKGERFKRLKEVQLSLREFGDSPGGANILSSKG